MSNAVELKEDLKYDSIWSLARNLKVGFRQVFFIDISSMDLESFYNLKYAAIKGKKKKYTKELDILKSKLQRRAVEE